MKKRFSYVLVIGLMLLLTGCHLTQSTAPIKSVEEVKQPETGIEQPPKVVTTDWKTILAPLVAELIQTTQPDANNLLLVSDIKNNTGDYLAGNNVSAALASLLREQDLYVVLDKSFVNAGKQALGISSDDVLVSRTKVVGLARYVNANYVLFTTINSLPKSPDIQANVALELISARTGEIIWDFSSDELSNNN